MESPYDVLGIDTDADDGAVVDAYRRRVKEAHPDHGGSVTEFQAVQTAYARILTGEGDTAPAPQDPVDEEPDEPGVSIEYLNYEVLADNGWSLDDRDLFEKAAAAGLETVDHGRMRVDPNDLLLGAAEEYGHAWPYACRGGACANCAVAVVDGDMSMPVDHILPQEMLERGIRLSCVGAPTTDELRVVYNVKHLPDLDDLRLPPHPFNRAQSDD